MSNACTERAAIFLTLTTVFVLIRMAPGDPAYALGRTAGQHGGSSKIRADMGLDKSVVPHTDLPGDLAPSESRHVVLVPGACAWTLSSAASRTPSPWRCQLILPTAVLSIPLGVWMARHADTRRELGANVVAVGGQSMPEFWSGLMLVTIFAVLIPVLPAAGFTTWPR